MLIQSESTKDLNLAILQAQGEFPVVGKTKDNDFYKRGGKASKYAGYDDVYSAIKPILVKVGIVVEHEHNVKHKEVDAQVIIKRTVLETGEETESNPVTQMVMTVEVVVSTTVIHVTSGEYKTIVSSTFPDKTNMHGVMAAVTYLKRYNLTSLLDIAVGDEDDDGNSGINAPEDQYSRSQRTQRGGFQRGGFPREEMANRNDLKLTTGTGKLVNLSDVAPGGLEPQPGDLPFDKELEQNNKPEPAGDEPWNDGSKAQGPAIDTSRPMTDAERKRLGLIGAKKIDALMILIQKKGITKDKWLAYIGKRGYTSISQIKDTEYDSVVAVVDKNPEKIMSEEVQ